MTVDALSNLIHRSACSTDGTHDPAAHAVPDAKREEMTDEVGMLTRNTDGSVAWVPWDRVPAEAVCPKCGEPIRWCLDMFSFTTGLDETHPFTLTHARCAWTDEGFRVQAALARAREIPGDELGIRDAARILGVHENTVRRYIDQGRLAALVLPRSGYRRLRRADVLALAAVGEDV